MDIKEKKGRASRAARAKVPRQKAAWVLRETAGVLVLLEEWEQRREAGGTARALGVAPLTQAFQAWLSS